MGRRRHLSLMLSFLRYVATTTYAVVHGNDHGRAISALTLPRGKCLSHDDGVATGGAILMTRSVTTWTDRGRVGTERTS